MSVTIDTGVTTDPIHTASPSVAQLTAMLEAAQAEASSVTREMARPVLEHLLESNVVKTSDKSGWTGFSTSVPITVDGTRYVLKFVVCDTAASDAAKEALKPTPVDPKVKKAADLRAQLAALDTTS